MKNDPVTFGTLHRFLVDLGFVIQAGKAGIVFDHALSGCRLFYPPYRELDEVGVTHLVATRHFLDQFGLVERDKSEDSLRRHALAS